MRSAKLVWGSATMPSIVLHWFWPVKRHIVIELHFRLPFGVSAFRSSASISSIAKLMGSFRSWLLPVTVVNPTIGWLGSSQHHVHRTPM